VAGSTTLKPAGAATVPVTGAEVDPADGAETVVPALTPEAVKGVAVTSGTEEVAGSDTRGVAGDGSEATTSAATEFAPHPQKRPGSLP